MTEAELRKMAQLEDRYWWFVGRRFIVHRLVNRFWRPIDNPALILDLGCGTGGNFALLRQWGTVVGLDASPIALRFARQRGMDLLVLGDGQQLPFADNAFDLVAVLDVLEHLDNDEQALREIWRVLKPNGAMVFTVPAFRSLWSVHDIALAHRRRYLYADLHRKIVAARFRVCHISYAICPLLPIVFVFRKGQNLLMRGKEPATALIELPRPLNQLLIALLQLEAEVLPRWWLPFGVSLVGVVKKPSDFGGQR